MMTTGPRFVTGSAEPALPLEIGYLSGRCPGSDAGCKAAVVEQRDDSWHPLLVVGTIDFRRTQIDQPFQPVGG